MLLCRLAGAPGSLANAPKRNMCRPSILSRGWASRQGLQISLYGKRRLQLGKNWLQLERQRRNSDMVLSQWRDHEHRKSRTPRSWITERKDLRCLRSVVKEIVAAAGIRNELSLASFRHGGFTEGTDSDLTDAELRAGGRHRSARQLPTYVKRARIVRSSPANGGRGGGRSPSGTRSPPLASCEVISEPVLTWTISTLMPCSAK